MNYKHDFIAENEIFVPISEKIIETTNSSNPMYVSFSISDFDIDKLDYSVNIVNRGSNRNDINNVRFKIFTKSGNNLVNLTESKPFINIQETFGKIEKTNFISR